MNILWLLTCTEPRYLWLMLLVPCLVTLYLISESNRSKRLLAFGDHAFLERVKTKSMRVRRPLKITLLCGAVTCLAIDLAKPSLLYRTVIAKPVDVALLLDVSQSMLASDVKPTRLGAAKLAVKTYLRRFEGARLALVIFAGESLLAVPLTQDKKTFNEYLDLVNTRTIPVQGTIIASALNLAGQSLPPSSNRARIIFLVTDGEDHEKGSLKAAKALRRAGIKLFILGVGTSHGSFIPDPAGGYKKDKQHRIVVTRFQPRFLDSLARAGGGISTALDLADLYNPRGAMEKILDNVPKGYHEEIHEFKVPVFLLLALAFLLMESMTFEKPGTFWKKLRSIGGKTRASTTLAVLLALTLVHPAGAQNFLGRAREGVSLYREGSYAKASGAFSSNLPEGPASPQLVYDLGTSLYKAHRYVEAEAWLRKVLSDHPDPQLASVASFNLGNALFKQAKYAESIGAFELSLKLATSDHDALYNLAYARYMLRRSRQNKPPPPQITLLRTKVLLRRAKVPLARKLEFIKSSTSTKGTSVEKDW